MGFKPGSWGLCLEPQCEASYERSSSTYFVRWMAGGDSEAGTEWHSVLSFISLPKLRLYFHCRIENARVCTCAGVSGPKPRESPCGTPGCHRAQTVASLGDFMSLSWSGPHLRKVVQCLCTWFPCHLRSSSGRLQKITDAFQGPGSSKCSYPAAAIPI